jgi:hypothetical protein
MRRDREGPRRGRDLSHSHRGNQSEAVVRNAAGDVRVKPTVTVCDLDRADTPAEPATLASLRGDLMTLKLAIDPGVEMNSFRPFLHRPMSRRLQFDALEQRLAM